MSALAAAVVPAMASAGQRTGRASQVAVPLAAQCRLAPTRRHLQDAQRSRRRLHVAGAAAVDVRHLQIMHTRGAAQTAALTALCTAASRGRAWPALMRACSPLSVGPPAGTNHAPQAVRDRDVERQQAAADAGGRCGAQHYHHPLTGLGPRQVGARPCSTSCTQWRGIRVACLTSWS